MTGSLPGISTGPGSHSGSQLLVHTHLLNSSPGDASISRNKDTQDNVKQVLSSDTMQLSLKQEQDSFLMPKKVTKIPSHLGVSWNLKGVIRNILLIGARRAPAINLIVTINRYPAIRE